MEHLVKRIYDFFQDNVTLTPHRTLSDFLKTVPEYRIKSEDGIDMVSMVVANYISSICKQMANDMLLIPLKPYNRQNLILEQKNRYHTNRKHYTVLMVLIAYHLPFACI